MNDPGRSGPVLAILLLGTTLLAACAKKAPPSGGPPDLTPPTVLESVPDSGASGVPRFARLSVTFSEGMEPRSTADAVSLIPLVEIERRLWKGNRLTLVLAESLEARQTYMLFVGTGARDRHGNVLVDGATVAFSTADSFPPGLLEGKIEAVGMTMAGIYLWCYDAAGGREPDSTARDFDALGLTDREGNFRIPGLPVPAEYRLWAFADLNSNRSFEPNTDVLVGIDTVFTLTRADPEARGLSVEIVNPRAPARVQGAVLDSLADSLGVIRVIATSLDDSTRRLVAPTREQNGFDLQLEAGRWRLRAFRDANENGRWDADDEPASEAQHLDLAPAAEIRDLTLVLRPRRTSTDTDEP